jgi:hypothetical protein
MNNDEDSDDDTKNNEAVKPNFDIFAKFIA